jgi:alkanesulfonate monooxygenase SsuD/methylene tetrahydromethanopterin reductase-like flavin-dependent oxidoreductase (luciferase family)
MDIAIMIEGQNGLNWPRWKRIVQAVEDLGFAGLYRSDHFTNSSPPDIDSLELWVSLAWLADNTRRIEFGPLVTPFSFRHPVHTARMASAVDDLSGGRLTLGLGAGWQAREHEKFGFQLLDIDGRFQRMQEGLEVVTRLLRSDSPPVFRAISICCKKLLFCRALSVSGRRPHGADGRQTAHPDRRQRRKADSHPGREIRR